MDTAYEVLDMVNRPFYNHGEFTIVNQIGERRSPTTTSNNYNLINSWLEQCHQNFDGELFIPVWFENEDDIGSYVEDIV